MKTSYQRVPSREKPRDASIALEEKAVLEESHVAKVIPRSSSSRALAWCCSGHLGYEELEQLPGGESNNNSNNDNNVLALRNLDPSTDADANLQVYCIRDNFGKYYVIDNDGYLAACNPGVNPSLFEDVGHVDRFYDGEVPGVVVRSGLYAELYISVVGGYVRGNSKDPRKNMRWKHGEPLLWLSNGCCSQGEQYSQSEENSGRVKMVSKGASSGKVIPREDAESLLDVESSGDKASENYLFFYKVDPHQVANVVEIPLGNAKAVLHFQQRSIQVMFEGIGGDDLMHFVTLDNQMQVLESRSFHISVETGVQEMVQWIKGLKRGTTILMGGKVKRAYFYFSEAWESLQSSGMCKGCSKPKSDELGAWKRHGFSFENVHDAILHVAPVFEYCCGSSSGKQRRSVEPGQTGLRIFGKSSPEGCALLEKGLRVRDEFRVQVRVLESNQVVSVRLWKGFKRLGFMKFIGLTAGAALTTLDVYVDCTICVHFFSKGFYIFGGISLLFILCNPVCCWAYLRKQGKEDVSFFKILTQVTVWEGTYKAITTGETDFEMHLYTMSETSLEAFPSGSFQIYTIYTDLVHAATSDKAAATMFQLQFSVFDSILTMSNCLRKFDFYGTPEGKISGAREACRFVFRFGEVSTRVCSLPLFGAYMRPQNATDHDNVNFILPIAVVLSWLLTYLVVKYTVEKPKQEDKRLNPLVWSAFLLLGSPPLFVERFKRTRVWLVALRLLELLVFAVCAWCEAQFHIVNQVPRLNMHGWPPRIEIQPYHPAAGNYAHHPIQACSDAELGMLGNVLSTIQRSWLFSWFSFVESRPSIHDSFCEAPALKLLSMVALPLFILGIVLEAIFYGSFKLNTETNTKAENTNDAFNSAVRSGNSMMIRMLSELLDDDTMNTAISHIWTEVIERRTLAPGSQAVVGCITVESMQIALKAAGKSEELAKDEGAIAAFAHATAHDDGELMVSLDDYFNFDKKDPEIEKAILVVNTPQTLKKLQELGVNLDCESGRQAIQNFAEKDAELVAQFVLCDKDVVIKGSVDLLQKTAMSLAAAKPSSADDNIVEAFKVLAPYLDLLEVEGLTQILGAALENLQPIEPTISDKFKELKNKDKVLTCLARVWKDGGSAHHHLAGTLLCELRPSVSKSFLDELGNFMGCTERDLTAVRLKLFKDSDKGETLISRLMELPVEALTDRRPILAIEDPNLAIKDSEHLPLQDSSTSSLATQQPSTYDHDEDEQGPNAKSILDGFIKMTEAKAERLFTYTLEEQEVVNIKEKLESMWKKEGLDAEGLYVAERKQHIIVKTQQGDVLSFGMLSDLSEKHFPVVVFRDFSKEHRNSAISILNELRNRDVLESHHILAALTAFLNALKGDSRWDVRHKVAIAVVRMARNLSSEDLEPVVNGLWKAFEGDPNPDVVSAAAQGCSNLLEQHSTKFPDLKEKFDKLLAQEIKKASLTGRTVIILGNVLSSQSMPGSTVKDLLEALKRTMNSDDVDSAARGYAIITVGQLGRIRKDLRNECEETLDIKELRRSTRSSLSSSSSQGGDNDDEHARLQSLTALARSRIVKAGDSVEQLVQSEGPLYYMSAARALRLRKTTPSLTRKGMNEESREALERGCLRFLPGWLTMAQPELEPLSICE